MRINTSRWKEFRLIDVYEIQMGNGLDKDKLDTDCPEINFVSRISYDNGVDGKVNRIEGEQLFDSGLMTVALGGEYLGSSFVQLRPFYTAQNVAVLKPRFSKSSDTFLTV